MTSVVRLGKRIPDRHRLLKVTLDSVSRKIQVLRNAKKLRNTQNWKEIFITPDMTPREREKNKELREELKRRRELGEERLVIRKGQITLLTMEGETRASDVEDAATSSDPFRG